MKALIFTLSLLLSSLCIAQAPYVFSTYTAEYQSIDGITPANLNDWEVGVWDDPFFTIPDLYNFEILGTEYSSTTQIQAGALMGFLEDNGDINHGFGLLSDIVDGDALEGASSSEISYINWITPESTTTIIQFSNVAFFDEVFGEAPSADNRMNFQIRFHTPSNAFEIHFGASTIPDPELIFFGASGPSVVLVVGVNANMTSFTYGATLGGDPANPDIYEVFGPDEEPQGLNAMPDSGRVYRFEPATNALAENTKPTFELSPTITSDFLRVSGSIQPYSKYYILDASGKKIQSGTLGSRAQIDVSAISPGLYLFAVEGQPGAMKFIKE